MSVLKEKYPTLFNYIDEDKLCVGYDPPFRLFFISSSEMSFIQSISFCPWTGDRLPSSLRDDLVAMVEKSGLSIFERSQWPRDWQSEDWWINAKV